MRDLWDLFLTFCRIGGLTFGGGYAMLPMLQKEVVENRRWATEEQIMDYYAVGQCTPGIIAVNTATFVGYNNRGVLGAIAATSGVVFPSLVIIMIIAAFISNFADLAIVQQAFAGIRVAVGVLVLNAIIKLWKSGVKDVVGIIIFAVTFVVSLIFSLSPVYVVIGAIIVGILAGRKRGVN
ncbi:chromate transporter [Clostridium culturomicium]|uniref:chromate transporter n=1 Tax=Clostridium culturomicium TaxID=1499683 RepID=UPI00058C5A46|nr:chromate transporter [Clostridium culturomicium]